MNHMLALIMTTALLGQNVLYAQSALRAPRDTTWTNAFAKTTYKVPASRQWQRAITVPLVLIGAGAYATTNNAVIDKYEVREERNEYFSTFRHHVDDYLQYAPIVSVYALNLAGVKGKHDFANRTALLVKSELMVAVLTFSLKKITAEPRPDTGQPTSFPSGHTAQAFAAATFMAKEYGHRSVWYAIGAYAVATGIGTLRVMNNRHWVSDVLAGAGVGILSTNIAYLTHHYKWGSRQNKHATIVVPSYGAGTVMVSLVHSFN